MSLRGKNFTEREKCKLLELVEKYKSLIENKSTNAVSILKKNEAWESITKQFNSSSETPRTLKQLGTAYLNLKRTTRKNVADDNVRRYLEHKQLTNLQLNPVGNDVEELHELFKQLKKDEVADKKGIMATGGGVYRPVLSSIGSQMLAVMGDQLKPLSNNYDSGSSYYKNDPQPCHSQPKEQEIGSPSPANKTEPIVQRPKNNTRNNQKRKITNNEILKRKYYRTKLECALIEKKTRILELNITKKKQTLLDLQIKIKEKELSQSTHF